MSTSIQEQFGKLGSNAGPLGEFTQGVMRGSGALYIGERELVAALTSQRNNCHF